MKDRLLKQAKFKVNDCDGNEMTITIELWNENNDFVVLKHFGDPNNGEPFMTDRIDNYGPEDDEKADMHFIYHCEHYMRKWLKIK